MEDKLIVKLVRKGGESYLYAKCEYLEKYFRETCVNYYGFENLRSVTNAEGEVAYQAYVLPSLNDSPYVDLRTGPHMLKQLGWLRAKGLGDGISIHLASHLDYMTAKSGLTDILDNIKEFMASMQDTYTITGTIEIRGVVA